MDLFEPLVRGASLSIRSALRSGPLYVFTINMNGVYFANSAAPTPIGTSLRNTRDAAGQPLGKLVMKAVATKQSASVGRKRSSATDRFWPIAVICATRR